MCIELNAWIDEYRALRIGKTSEYIIEEVCHYVIEEFHRHNELNAADPENTISGYELLKIFPPSRYVND